MHSRQEPAPKTRRVSMPVSPRSLAHQARAPGGVSAVAAADVFHLHGTVGNCVLARRLARPAEMVARTGAAVLQRVAYHSMEDMWAEVVPDVSTARIAAIVAADPNLAALYADAAEQLFLCDFSEEGEQVAQITAQEGEDQLPYRVTWSITGDDPDYRVGAVIHELAHAAAAEQYDRGGQDEGAAVWRNMHLPDQPAARRSSRRRQEQRLIANWQMLERELQADEREQRLVGDPLERVWSRLGYALITGPAVHNETVLADLLYYLRAKGLVENRTYRFATVMLEETNERRALYEYTGPESEVRLLQPPPFPPVEQPAAAQPDRADDAGYCAVM